MSQNTQTFILVGDFKDNITPKLRKLDRAFKDLSKQLDKNFANSFKSLDKGVNRFEKNTNKVARSLSKELSGITKGFDKGINQAGRSLGNLETSMMEVGRSAGKVRDIVSTIGENHKGFDSMAESMAGIGRAAGRSRDEVDGMAEGLGKAQGKAKNLMETLLKAEGLSKMGDAIAQGFSRGFGTITGVARKGAGFVAAQYRKAMEDEMADIKATTSVQGSFTRAGFKGGAEGGGLTYEEAGKFYKKFDVQIAEMIRTSSAPTSKVVELQRFTMDTLGPLLLAAENVPKGTNVKDITPNTIKKVSTTYGGMLEQIALLAQGTGTATFRVAQGVEGLIKSGKIDTTMDFFTDNVLLMQALQDAGFAGGGAARGGLRVSTLTNEADRLKALQKALETAQSREGIKKMSESLTGSIQGLMDTLTNPSVGVFGMATTFSEKEQKNVDTSIKQVYNARIADLKKELKNNKITAKRREQLEKDIKREQDEVDYLTKEGASQITSPFKAFNLMFGKMIRSLTEALNAIGPIWNRFAITAIQWTDKFLRPLDIALKNVASDMRADFAETGGQNQALNIGRIFGEIYKFLGEALGDLAKALTDPKGALGKSQSQFMQGFYAAFKEKGSFEKAKKGMVDGINALVTKLFQLIGSILTSEEMRPIVKPFVIAMFGPPMISAVISGITPLLIAQSGKFFMALFAKAGSVGTMGLSGGIGGMGATISGWLGAVGSALGLLARVLPPIALTLAAIVLLGGGVENAMRQLQQVFGEIGHTLEGSFSGLADVFGTLFAFIGDLGSGIGRLINSVTGANVQLDMLKILLVPITAPLQALELGLLGLNVALTKVRSLMANWLGTEEEKKAAYKASVDADVKMRAAQGRQNAYNMSALGPEALKKGLNDALFELTNSKELKASRSSELKSFVTEARAQLGMKPVPKPTAQTPATPAKPGAPAATPAPTAAAPGPAPVAQIPAAALAPVQQAISTGTATTQQVSAAVKTAALAAATQATAQGNRTNNLIAGLNVVKGAMTAISGKISAQSASLTQIAANTAATNGLLKSGAVKVKFEMSGLGGKGGPGAVDQFTPIASSFGLQTTSGYRAGDPGYHGVNRARDYSNGTGPTPQMMKFATMMAATYGPNLAELIYTPLGFGIKNGMVVPPYAEAAHYNHVHVAYAHGLNNPRLFSSVGGAEAYEGMYAPTGAQVKTITANTSENLGGTYNVTQNITISGSEDPRRLAEMVFNYAAQASQHITNSSFA